MMRCYVCKVCLASTCDAISLITMIFKVRLFSLIIPHDECLCACTLLKSSVWCFTLFYHFLHNHVACCPILHHLLDNCVWWLSLLHIHEGHVWCCNISVSSIDNHICCYAVYVLSPYSPQMTIHYVSIICLMACMVLPYVFSSSWEAHIILY